MYSVFFHTLLLFVITFLSGLLVFLLPNLHKKNFRNVLSFSGAYLFSMTVIHILPELFLHANNEIFAGIFVLVGFYFQIIINYLSTGVEHGHIHISQNQTANSAYVLFGSLGVHSLLEGSLLVHPHVEHQESDVLKLMFGLLLHKVPEAIALVSVLVYKFKNIWKSFVLLIIYSACSPVGMLFSQMFANSYQIDRSILTYLFAVVAGNFLHISTTIFFESEAPGHTLKFNKLSIMVLAAIFAIVSELFL